MQIQTKFEQLRPRGVAIPIYPHTQKVPGDLNSVGRKGWAALLATKRALGAGV